MTRQQSDHPIQIKTLSAYAVSFLVHSLQETKRFTPEQIHQFQVQGEALPPRLQYAFDVANRHVDFLCTGKGLTLGMPLEAVVDEMVDDLNSKGAVTFARRFLRAADAMASASVGVIPPSRLKECLPEDALHPRVAQALDKLGRHGLAAACRIR